MEKHPTDPAASRPVEAEDYLLGCDPEELSRLGFQHRVWAASTYDLWERAGFSYGARVADLGCGPGFATLDLAHLLGPRGRVLACDGSRSFLDYLGHQAVQQGIGDRIELLHGDLHEAELGEESVDGAYARWVFCFLHSPEEVVKRVARALRPGSRLAISDYFNYRAFTFGPRGAAMDRVVDAVQEAWRGSDGNLGVQGSLPSLLEAYGFRLLSLEPLQRLALPDSPLWHWPRTFFDTFLPKLVDLGLITQADAEAFDQEWVDRAALPGAFLNVPPVYQLVAEKR